MIEIKGTTKVCGLIGNPVEHSLSPMIHNELSRMSNSDMVYVTFKVEKDILTAVGGAFELNVNGMNVTVPWKEKVICTLCETDKLAGDIGAVNTLVRTERGFKGYNTDIIGFKRQLEDDGIDIKGNTVVLLGAGGAARAIAFLLVNEGAGCVYILNRTVEKAQRIADDIRTSLGRDVIKVLPISEYKSIAESEYIVVQTTNVGLHPNIDDTVISDKEFYDNARCGVDIIYNPFNTKFMKLMRLSGKPSYNGLKMLLYQAVAAYELWNDTKISRSVTDEVYKMLCRHFEEV